MRLIIKRWGVLVSLALLTLACEKRQADNAPPSDQAAPADAVPPAPGPTIGGSLDKANCTFVAGWAFDPKQPDQPVIVEILDGTTVLASVEAKDLRPDLKTAGKGNGQHAFRFQMPASVKDGKPHSISVRVASTQEILRGSPISVTCPH